MNIKISAKEILEKVCLKDYENFINIDKRFYGGNQIWLYKQGYTSRFWANRSCGVTALANLTGYLAQSRREFRDLYPFKSFSMDNFTNHQYNIYKYLNPAVYGIASVYKMKRGLKNYIKFKDVILSPRTTNWNWNMENILEYIKSGLTYDHPVLLLTWNNPLSDYKYHWITITGYIRTTDNKNYIIASNWGKKKIYSLDQWFENWSFYKGLIYFE